MNGTSPTAYFTESDAHLPTAFAVDILDTAFAFGKLFMLTAVSVGRGKEQGAAEALSAVAVGMLKLIGRMHAQPDGTQRRAIRIALKDRVAMLIEGNGSNTAMTSSALIDVPGIKGGIGRHMGGIEAQRDDGTLVEGAIVRHIGLIEGLGVLSEHDIAIGGNGGRRHAGAIAPQVFLDFFGRAVGLLLIGRALDANAAVGIAGRLMRFVKAISDVTFAGCSL